MPGHGWPRWIEQTPGGTFVEAGLSRNRPDKVGTPPALGTRLRAPLMPGVVSADNRRGKVWAAQLMIHAHPGSIFSLTKG